MPGSWTDAPEAAAPHEAGKLHLAIDKARELLAWRPAWDFSEAVRATAAWYQAEQQGEKLCRKTQDQIRDYHVAARVTGNPWVE